MTQRSQRNGLLLLVLVLGAAAVGVAVGRDRIRDAVIEWRKPPVPSERPRSSPTTTPSPTFGRPSHTPTPTPTAQAAVNLAVPFQAQAPRGDWSLPWQEACEEASAVLTDAFWRGERTLSVDEMETRILQLVDWSTRTLGYYQHTTAAETARYLREALGYRRVEVEYEVGVDRIAHHVRAGRPVIVPLAGRELGNPYYTQPGPVYHMLVVKGIAENGDVITNDVGTRHGRNLTYAPDVFEAAMHEVPLGGDSWPPNTDPVAFVRSGRKAIIVVYPN